MQRVSIKMIASDARRSVDMPHWTGQVREVHVLYEGVKRLMLADDVSVDMPTRLLNVDRADLVKVEVHGAKQTPAACSRGCILRGVVYANEGGATFVSCGGLICRVPTCLPVDEEVYVIVSKSRRRARE